MTEAMGIIIGAIVGGVSGAISVLIGAWLTNRAAERKRADNLFSTALEFMGGGTQRRNLGIAAITLYWREFPKHKQLCAEMLIGSAIYLLTESEQEDASHEVFNLHRIMTLLNDIAPDLKDHEGYKRLGKEVDKRTASHDQQPRPKRGLWVDKSALAAWQHDLKEFTG